MNVYRQWLIDDSNTVRLLAFDAHGKPVQWEGQDRPLPAVFLPRRTADVIIELLFEAHAAGKRGEPLTGWRDHVKASFALEHASPSVTQAGKRPTVQIPESER